MKSLKQHLQTFGYECVLPNLPLTYLEFDLAAKVLEEMLDEYFHINLEDDEKIHFVGHSTGGLVIRKLLNDTKYINKIGRCVLIATPNKGSHLANLASRMKPYVHIYKTLKSLSYDYLQQQQLEISHPIEMAAIAGTRNNLLLGRLITEQNDGRVEVNSVQFSGLKDFITLPYGHKDIHHQMETATHVDSFLKTGKLL